MKLSKLSFAILIGALLLGVLGFWFWQKNTYSKETLKLEIIAPAEATMGEEIEYVVKYKNNGDIRLENPVLVFQYPAGSLASEDSEERVTMELEDIYPGQEQNFSFKARLFGKEQEVKEAKTSLQYTPKNLNAQFESETIATTVLSQVPLTFELDLPSRTESGQQFSFALNYFSNSSYPLSDLRIKLEYPSGFVFKEASPAPLGESEWKVGVLNRAEGGRITVQGSLEGSVQEVKIIKATLGMWREGRFTVLKEVNRGIEITSPKLLISQSVNGSPEYVASPGDVLHYVVSFKNVSDKSHENLFLVLALEGRPFDLQSVKTGTGTFQQGDNSIIFEAKNNPRLRFLGKGEEGEVEFWVNVKEDWETFSPQDKSFSLRNRVILSEVAEEFMLKVNSKLAVEQKVLFQDTTFSNQGPIPPQAGAPTTYTVLWEAKNRYNDMQNVKVKATLPQEVSLTGLVFPKGAPLTFDQVSREVVWEVGDLSAGTGVHTEAPSAAFQIRFTPQSSQRGGLAQLIQEARIIGDDLFTTFSLAAIDEAKDTSLSDDDSVSSEQGIVQ